MDKEIFFENWKEDWEERKDEFASDQAELFRTIRDNTLKKKNHKKLY